MPGRAEIIGIGQDMVMESPFTGNTSCVPVFTETYGNSPVNVTIRNFGAGFRGYHRYTLAFYTNYTFVTKGLTFASAAGAGPGLQGVAWASCRSHACSPLFYVLVTPST